LIRQRHVAELRRRTPGPRGELDLASLQRLKETFSKEERELFVSQMLGWKDEAYIKQFAHDLNDHVRAHLRGAFDVQSGKVNLDNVVERIGRLSAKDRETFVRALVRHGQRWYLAQVAKGRLYTAEELFDD
jgi:hypothetical protein